MAASFRSYLAELKKNDELIDIAKPTDPRNIAALVAQSEKALLFKNVIGYSMPVAAGLLQSRNRIAIGMGGPYKKSEAKRRAAMDHPIKPRRVKRAPVKNVVLTKIKVNLFDLPVPIFSLMDGGPMITGGIVIAEDTEYGVKAGMARVT